MTTTNLTNAQALDPLQTLVGDDQTNFLQEVGNLIFQSALMRYLSSVTEAEAETFENFVEKHASSEEFMDNLCAEYPAFEATLTEEMAEFMEEAKALAL